MPGTVAALRGKVFARHSNPWSAWTRWLTTPLVLVPVWTRKWSHAGIVAAWMVANAVAFPPPKHERAFATRAMLGEELWITERPKDAAMLVSAGSSVLLLAALIAARRHKAGAAAGAAGGSMALTMYYWKQMVAYREQSSTRTGHCA
ncbi:DUF6653 family protein [Amycolatopsis cihanbeyliensis]|uniref:Uncharacterized protein n=1 Tax=Amycolatopsis cihanbeyliensis TaxID=1128664 RepID=A0A542DP74_AMYCI|nr:DUF6653 family protein [Amycolatopsis cihanbeyliensis]TQJ04898.1 hypothetical protein FB471_4708 [Amycolatopsis cihanbeyliensis]